MVPKTISERERAVSSPHLTGLRTARPAISVEWEISAGNHPKTRTSELANKNPPDLRPADSCSVPPRSLLPADQMVRPMKASAAEADAKAHNKDHHQLFHKIPSVIRANVHS